MCYKNPAISIIIPVYNVEKYLKKALDSVKNQTFKDFEAIIVNDGSTDRSYEIAKEYVDKNSNFHLINQMNMGLGPARNAGLKVAKGEFVAFLDSDDYLYPKYLEILYNNAIKTGADISCCNFTFLFDKSGCKLYMPFTSKSGVFSGEAALKKLIMDLKIHYFCWNKLCKRSLFVDNDIKFYNIFFEDIATSPQLFYYSKKVVITSKSLYCYRRRGGSILSTVDAQKINDLMLAINIMRDFLEREDVFDKYRIRFKLYLSRIKLQNLLYIFGIHAASLNFKGIVNNYKNSEAAMNMLGEEKYKLQEDITELPCYIKQPENKRLKDYVVKN